MRPLPLWCLGTLTQQRVEGRFYLSSAGPQHSLDHGVLHARERFLQNHHVLLRLRQGARRFGRGGFGRCSRRSRSSGGRRRGSNRNPILTDDARLLNVIVVHLEGPSCGGRLSADLSREFVLHGLSPVSKSVAECSMQRQARRNRRLHEPFPPELPLSEKPPMLSPVCTPSEATVYAYCIDQGRGQEVGNRMSVQLGYRRR